MYSLPDIFDASLRTCKISSSYSFWLPCIRGQPMSNTPIFIRTSFMPSWLHVLSSCGTLALDPVGGLATRNSCYYSDVRWGGRAEPETGDSVIPSTVVPRHLRNSELVSILETRDVGHCVTASTHTGTRQSKATGSVRFPPASGDMRHATCDMQGTFGSYSYRSIHSSEAEAGTCPRPRRTGLYFRFSVLGCFSVFGFRFRRLKWLCVGELCGKRTRKEKGIRTCGSRDRA